MHRFRYPTSLSRPGVLLACLAGSAAVCNADDVITHISQHCAAKATIDYLQNNTIATVDGKIENTYCGASSGSYQIRIRIRGDDGEIEQLMHDETWQRGDDQAVEFHHEYAIPDNVDLLNVRIRKLRCLCAESQNTEQAIRPPPEEGENHD